MKTRALLLTAVVAISSVVMFVTPAQAHDRKHHHRHDNSSNYGYYKNSKNSYYSSGPVYYRNGNYNRPRYYGPAPVSGLQIGISIGN